MLEKVLNFISYFHWYDIILFSAFLLLAMCFTFLSFIFFRRKILSIPCFLLGFIMLILIPFAMRYCMEEKFYKIEIDKAYDGVYNYSDVYQYIATITNVGKRNIAGCVLSHQILYDTSNESGITKYKHMILNYVKPKQIYNKDIPMDLKVGQSVQISEIMENYQHRGEKYVTKVECYGKKHYGDTAKPLQGVVLPKKEQNDTAESTQVQERKIDENLENEFAKQIQEFGESPQTQTESNASSTNTQMQDSNQNQTSQQEKEDSNATQNAPSSNTPQQDIPQPQGIPPQIPPTQDDGQYPDWKKERDNFHIPLLKETPR